MKFFRPLLPLAAAGALSLTLGSGCLVVSEQDEFAGDGCEQVCTDYEVCETYRDAWGLWEECWPERECALECIDPAPIDQPAECVSDIECVQSESCVGGVCVARAAPSDAAAAGLCQACDATFDCAEPEARCIQLSYQHASKSGEKVCSRICEIDDDCPIAFECVKVSQEAGVPAQCLPKADSAGQRTCTNNAALECVKAKDCGVGESCVNNTCVAPNRPSGPPNPTEPECVRSTECDDGARCVDNVCVIPATACVLNSECAQGGRCVDGQCRSTCSSTESAECGEYERCRIASGQSAGVCAPLECRRKADCEAGQTCSDAACVPTCSTKEECGEGFICGGFGYCERDPNVECRTSAECAASEVCSQGSCAQPCDCNQQCPDAQVCNTETGLCGAPAAPATQCANDCECPSGQKCDAGTCG